MKRLRSLSEVSGEQKERYRENCTIQLSLVDELP